MEKIEYYLRNCKGKGCELYDRCPLKVRLRVEVDKLRWIVRNCPVYLELQSRITDEVVTRD